MRYRLNDYSVPTAYGHQKVLVRGYVHEVIIACGAEVIARHPRSYEREDFVFTPLHYLALIEQKANALDQAAPLADWKLPEEFATLRRLLEARMGKSGKREFVQVLRLMEVFKIDDVAAAVRDAIARGAVGFDAVKHLVLCRIERCPPRLDMTIYPYLPKATVATTSARSYMDLFSALTKSLPPDFRPKNGRFSMGCDDGETGGCEGEVQGDLMMTWAEMPHSPGHVFYDRLQNFLAEAEVRRFRRRNVHPLLRAEDGRAVVAAGSLFPHAHDRIF